MDSSCYSKSLEIKWSSRWSRQRRFLEERLQSISLTKCNVCKKEIGEPIALIRQNICQREEKRYNSDNL